LASWSTFTVATFFEHRLFEDPEYSHFKIIADIDLSFMVHPDFSKRLRIREKAAFDSLQKAAEQPQPQKENPEIPELKDTSLDSALFEVTGDQMSPVCSTASRPTSIGLDIGTPKQESAAYECYNEPATYESPHSETNESAGGNFVFRNNYHDQMNSDALKALQDKNTKELLASCFTNEDIWSSAQSRAPKLAFKDAVEMETWFYSVFEDFLDLGESSNTYLEAISEWPLFEQIFNYSWSTLLESKLSFKKRFQEIRNKFRNMPKKF